MYEFITLLFSFLEVSSYVEVCDTPGCHYFGI